MTISDVFSELNNSELEPSVMDLEQMFDDSNVSEQEKIIKETLGWKEFESYELMRVQREKISARVAHVTAI